MFVHSNEKNYLFLCLCLFVSEIKKYMELNLAKLEFHITRNSNLGSSSTVEGKISDVPNKIWGSQAETQ